MLERKSESGEMEFPTGRLVFGYLDKTWQKFMIIMIVIMIAIMIMIISNIVYIIILYIFISHQVQAVPWAPGLKKICEISKVLWEWIFNSSLWQLPIYDYQLKCRYCESENKPITDLVNAKVRNIKKSSQMKFILTLLLFPL